MLAGEATVCIPWRPGPARMPVFDRCVGWWESHGFPVIATDSDPGLGFLANQARNNAVRQATTDVVILADADTIPDHVEQIRAGIEHAKAGAVVWPHTNQKYVDSQWASSTCPLSVVPCREERGGFSASLLIISRAAYWGIGGFDERFTPGVGGWDDVSFAMCAATLLRVVRVRGCSWSFEINGSSFCDASSANPNWERYLLYARANKQGEEAMRALLATRPEVPKTPIGAVL